MAVNRNLLAKRMTLAISSTSAQVRATRHEEGTAFTLRRIDAGKLIVPTGRVCVSDAYSADEFPPLNRIVSPGEYPVELVIAELPKDLPFGNDRCAFVVVTFDEAPVVSWEPVTAVAAADPCFTEENPNGIVQEGGTGLFSPEASAVHFALLYQQFDEQLEVIRGQAERFGRHEWVNYRPGSDPANVVICEGGMGDGHYECFTGLTKAGRVARLVIDYDIADPITT